MGLSGKSLRHPWDLCLLLHVGSPSHRPHRCLSQAWLFPSGSVPASPACAGRWPVDRLSGEQVLTLLSLPTLHLPRPALSHRLRCAARLLWATPLFPHLVFSLPSALRPLLSHPKETCLRVTFFDHPVLLRYSSPQCSIVSSVTLIVICSYFIYLLVYFFVCVRRRIVNSLRAPPCLSCPWVVSLEPTRRLAWRST